jgi:Arylsulfotransferase (ASST)
VVKLDRNSDVIWTYLRPGHHDVDIAPHGRIYVLTHEIVDEPLDYGNFAQPEGRSRVIEFDLETTAIVWQYAGSAERPLESAIRSSQQRLANGNTLITESSGGRILEVTRTGDIVWQFVNPIRGGAEGALLPIVCWAQRLDADALHPTLVTRPVRAK